MLSMSHCPEYTDILAFNKNHHCDIWKHGFKSIASNFLQKIPKTTEKMEILYEIAAECVRVNIYHPFCREAK